jgi:hypothetical protein
MNTVSGVSTNLPTSFEASETPPVALSPELALMAMMVENDFAQSEADRVALHAARRDQMDHMKDALEAAYDQADATRTEALIQGTMTMAGSGTAIACTFEPFDDPKWNARLGQVGSLSSSLAGPMGSFIGGAAKEDAEAAQMAAEQGAKQAEWAMDDARSHREQEQQAADRVMQQAQGIVETQHQATIAVLSNF